MRKIPALALISMCSSLAFAMPPSLLLPEQFSAAPAGKALSTQLIVTMVPASAGPCLAIKTQHQDIDILISKTLLDDLAASEKADGAGDEAHRLHVIHARRAQQLLDTVSSVTDANGCAVASTNAETQYLIARLLSSGQVTILDTRTRAIFDSMVATVSAMPGVGGMVVFKVHDTHAGFRPFFAYQAWVH